MRKGIAAAFGFFILMVLTAKSAFAVTATLTGCVYEKDTGAPIKGAIVFVQLLDTYQSASATTGADGCVDRINVNASLYKGDYIEASIVKNGRVYVQQYRIPSVLLDKTYRYDFYLDILPAKTTGPDNGGNS